MNVAIILAGGTGTRMGLEIPKQYYEVNGKAVISYCLHTFLTHEKIDAVQIVADEMWQEYIMQQLSVLPNREKFKGFSVPGENRQLSVYHALTDIRGYASDNDFVIVHDAARPCVSAAQISDCLKAAAGHDGTLPVLAMKDTVYLSEDKKIISSLLDRGKVFAGQAPEVFLLGRYYEANRALLPDKILEINGSAEPAIMAGMDIAMISGDERNFKITTVADLQKFEQIQKKEQYEMCRS
ncbi:MAG: 2-C-methyl-D-erythritol 4-phosphate cytidylyltransferase [Lachnospiraceae bacterium]|jgi:2-C-methyl-D-erythritol 4-phosphate cytidylyltransferase